MRIAGNLGDLGCTCGPRLSRNKPRVTRSASGLGFVDLTPMLQAGNAVAGQTTNNAQVKQALNLAVTGASAGSSIAAMVGTGSALGPVGAAIGAAVGVLASVMKKKEDRDNLAWKAYVTVAGRAPGRAYDETPFELAWQGLNERVWDKGWKKFHQSLLDNPQMNGTPARNIPQWIAYKVVAALCSGHAKIGDDPRTVYTRIIKPIIGPIMYGATDTNINQILIDWIDRVLAGLPIGETKLNTRQPHLNPIDIVRELCGAALNPPAGQTNVPATVVGNQTSLPVTPVVSVPTSTLPAVPETSALLPVPVRPPAQVPQKSNIEKYGPLVIGVIGLAIALGRN